MAKKAESIKPELASINALVSLPALNTHSLFSTASVGNVSPIDEFLRNTREINRLYSEYIPKTKPLPKELASIVLLGYMSAVEGYIRSVMRELILVDDHMLHLAKSANVTYGAALHYPTTLLPEATMDGENFSGKARMTEAFRQIVGIKGNFPTDVQAALDAYQKICEIRHCCVHRFGKLGMKNASILGLPDHTAVLENYFSPNVDELQTVLDAIRTCAKTFNNYLCKEVLARTCQESKDANPVFRNWDWTWSLRSDKKRFARYYRIFSTELDTPPSLSLKDFYKSFVKAFRVTVPKMKTPASTTPPPVVVPPAAHPST